MHQGPRCYFQRMNRCKSSKITSRSSTFTFGLLINIVLMAMHAVGIYCTYAVWYIGLYCTTHNVQYIHTFIRTVPGTVYMLRFVCMKAPKPKSSMYCGYE